MVGKRKINQIAKRYVSGLITYYDGFYSGFLSEEENDLVQEQCIKIALKLFDGENSTSTDEIVKTK